ncbi:redoxin domain-containing protein [Candidatus Avelusimicrobium faecicola]|uniref:TlpA family protein disulfide reductase n=1 Tax=Candidatus Avelusimicrobium faecicola TaxID=3416205 RepID=UPI0015A4190D|nr:TlpA family protein disulfide reductase [Spirochaetota bacterium]MCI7536496.1 TlpA family protein disulfide reductase [Spirochaetota bacterium]MDY2940459.1 TlpA disulfide reductase family protein [Elusimicrobiaceae bacterium]
MKKIYLLAGIFCLAGVLNAAPAATRAKAKKVSAAAQKRAKATAKVKQKPAAATVQFALPTVRRGDTWTTADYTGTPLLVAVVSSGCPHCQKTLPQLEEARKALRNVQFVAVFTDSEPQKPLALLRKDNLRFDAVYNGQGVANQFKVDGVPMLFLFDAKHQLIKTFEGYAEDRVKELKSAAGNLEKEVSMVSLERK